MGLARRVTLSIAAAVSLMAALTVASVGAAGGFGQAPGHYNFNDTGASVSAFNPVDQSSENISVDRSLFRFRPKGGGGFVTQNMTVLFVDVFVPNIDPTQPPLVSAFGCFVIPASDFTVSSDLQTALLNATVNESDFCPGFLSPVFGPAGGKGPGPGPGGSGLTFPLTVTGSWTGTGLVGDQSDHGLFTCGTFRSITSTDSQTAFSSSVSATISGFASISGGMNVFGTVNVNAQQLQVTGTGILPAGCFPGGKGG